MLLSKGRNNLSNNTNIENQTFIQQCNWSKTSSVQYYPCPVNINIVCVIKNFIGFVIKQVKAFVIRKKLNNKRVEQPINYSSVVLQINKRKVSKRKKENQMKSFCFSVSVFRFLHSKEFRSLFIRKLNIKMALKSNVVFVSRKNSPNITIILQKQNQLEFYVTLQMLAYVSHLERKRRRFSTIRVR